MLCTPYLVVGILMQSQNLKQFCSFMFSFHEFGICLILYTIVL
jgi:hypothetical protein